MKARIPNIGAGGLTLDGGGLDIVVPDGRVNIKDFFTLDSFKLSESEVEPLHPCTVSWSISPKRQDIDPADYMFELFGPDESHIKDIPLIGSAKVHPRATSFLYIRGRRRDGGSSPLGDPHTLTVDFSKCQVVEVPKELLNAVVTVRVDQIADSVAEIKRRSTGPIASEWTSYSISYDIPLKLILDNFFDADLDLGLTLALTLTHGEQTSDLDLTITDKAKADFHWAEDVASLGSTNLVTRMIERVVPLILKCPLQQAESQVLREIFRLGAVRDALNARMRLLSVTLDTTPGFEHLRMVFCPVPDESNAGLMPGGFQSRLSRSA